MLSFALAFAAMAVSADPARPTRADLTAHCLTLFTAHTIIDSSCVLYCAGFIRKVERKQALSGGNRVNHNAAAHVRVSAYRTSKHLAQWPPVDFLEGLREIVGDVIAAGAGCESTRASRCYN